MAPSKVDQELATMLGESMSKLSITKFGRPMRQHFSFDPEWINLNHGSYGSAPRSITSLEQYYVTLSERRPDEYIRFLYPPLLTASRTALSHLLSTPRSNLVLVPNATTGVNTVLRNLRFQPGDKILYFSFIYGACGYTVQYIAETTPAEAVELPITLPISDDDLLSQFTAAVAANPGIKVAVFDTITSMPAVRIPFERLTEACRRLGVLSVIDGAHGIGQIPLNLGELDPDFFVSNLHKWLFVPRGCAVMYVAPRNQKMIRSALPTSWGFVPKVQTVSPLLPKEKNGQEGVDEGFGELGDEAWTEMFVANGTIDNANYTLVPAALKFRKEVCGGEEAIHRYLLELGDKAQEIYKTVLGVTESFGEGTAMRNIRLPLDLAEVKDVAAVGKWIDQKFLEEETFLPLFLHNGGIWIRVSAQIYLDEKDLRKGAELLKKLCAKIRSGEWMKEQ